MDISILLTFPWYESNNLCLALSVNSLRPSDEWCVSKLTIIGQIMACRRQTVIWTNIVKSILRNKRQWNLKGNLHIFIQNAFETVVWKISAILSRSQCVDTCTSARVLIGFSHFIKWWRNTPLGDVQIACDVVPAVVYETTAIAWLLVKVDAGWWSYHK